MEDKFWELAAKYLSNEASDYDMKALFKLMEEHNLYRQYFDDLAKKWGHLEEHQDFSFDLDKARRKVLSETIPQKSRMRFLRNYGGEIVKIAAVLVLVLGIYHVTNNNENTWKEFTTNEKEKLKIVLPDSTLVWLNANSALSYNFSEGNQRNLILKGEAFFDVKRDTTRPFVIKSEHFETRVLGTSFNVEANQNSNHLVSVISGRVSVTGREEREKLYLNKGDQAYFDVQSGIMDRRQINAIVNEKAWIDRSFVFKNTPVKEVLGYLSETYNIEFNLEHESLGNCLLTAKFNNENLITIMNMMSTSLGYTYDYNNEERKIDIQGKGCKKNREIGTSPG